MGDLALPLKRHGLPRTVKESGSLEKPHGHRYEPPEGPWGAPRRDRRRSGQGGPGLASGGTSVPKKFTRSSATWDTLLGGVERALPLIRHGPRRLHRVALDNSIG